MKEVMYCQMTDSQKSEALLGVSDLKHRTITEDEYYEEYEGEFDFYENENGEIITRRSF